MKKKIIIGVCAFMIIGVISGLIHNITGTTPKNEAVEPNNVKTDIPNAKADLLVCPEFTSEEKSTARADEIASVAKDNAADLTAEQTKEIISTIKSANHNFYSTTGDMEKFMWYGYLLDYKYDDSDPISLLGNDLYQAIKYVYRGVEAVTDHATQENLLQIDKDLQNIE